LAAGRREPATGNVTEVGGKGVTLVRPDGSSVSLGRLEYMRDRHIPIDETAVRMAESEQDKGRSVSFVALDQNLAGFIATADTPKKNAAEVITELRSLGISRLVMLTGDNERTAASICKVVGITEWKAGLLPGGKVDALKTLQQEGLAVMVGDGVNDAAALSIAGVGVAMGGLGSEGTIESAQIVLMRDDLAALPVAIRLARKARAVSFQDFIIWGATNVAGLVLVFSGLIGPAGAAAYNFLSDFLPLGNSLRVRASRAR
jgi:P-type E1-E2 ATPase